MASLKDKVDFNFVRYSNCWEDPEILLEGLKVKPGDRVFSIASAGDNSFSLLTKNPEIVIASDINKAQLYLIELKKVAIMHLEYPDVLEFLGFRHSTKRLDVFKLLSPFLSEKCRIHWNKNLHFIKKGVIFCGKFERYFKVFRKFILPFIAGKRKVLAFFQLKSETEQISFYYSKWNSFRWRLLFKLFFNKQILGRFGRDPHFFDEVKENVGKYIFAKAEKHLVNPIALSSEFLRFIMMGNYNNLLPHYMRHENFIKIKENINRLIFIENFADKTILEFEKFDCLNLSDIFEYMDDNSFRAVVDNISKGCNPGARFAYWNLMVNRKLSDIRPEKFTHNLDLSKELTLKDKGFFYNRFIIDVFHQGDVKKP